MDMARPHPGPHPQERESDAASIVLERAEELLAPHRARFDALLSVVAAGHGLAPAHFLGPNKLKRMMAVKREAVQLAIECLVPPLNVEVIGLFFGLSRSAIYRLDLEARKLIRVDPEFVARLERLRPRVREAIKRAEVRAEVWPSTTHNGENYG